MPAQTLDAFFRSLPRGEPARAYYLHGPEDLLKDEALRAILDRTLHPSLRDFNLDQRSAGELDADSLFGLCTTLPMMAERRVVVLREVEALKRKPKVRAALLQYLGRPAPDTVLVLIQGANEGAEDKELAKSAVAVACEPLPEDRVLKWLDRRAKGLGVELPDNAARHLVRAVGGELASLAAELDKIAALPSGESLTVERIGELVGVRHG
jgi:DNA polymerase III subunit delta